MAVPIEKLDRMTVSSIETFFDGLFRGADKLTENLFFNALPVNIEKGWTDLAIVDVGNPVLDKNAYARGTVLVQMYAKQNAYGIKEVSVLQRMEKALNRLIASNMDPHYNVSIRGRYSNYDAVNDVFYNVIQLNIVIT